MNKTEKYRSLQFPKFGVDVSMPAFDQRPGTSPSVINCRAYDAVTDRERGGSRAGLTPFFGAGSVAQVSGFNRIQSLSTIVTASLAGTFTPFVSIYAVVNYSETDHPPVRNAPEGTPTYQWFEGTTPTLVVISNVVVGTPDGGGTGQGTASFVFSTDGVNVTIVGTFQSAGFAGPYAYIGPPQVVTKTVTAAFFFNFPGFVAFSWTVANFTTGFVATLDIVFRGY